VPERPEIERRKMFGFPCAFVNGNMFTGLHATNMIVRLAEPERSELLAIDGARIFEPMPGRPMREYVVLPDAILRDDEQLQTWLDKSFAFASSLPIKERKPRAKKSSRGR
jgi:TfoX/Sxy family transcriptional regulator of competence genes